MDSFGYVCWNQNDTGIGQRLEDLATVVDIISPMLYPSGFQFGIPGYRNPVAESLRNRLPLARGVQKADGQHGGALQALAAGVHRLCLWRKGTSAPTRSASRPRRPRDAGTDGWMLWNPRNVYSTNDIKPEPVDAKARQPTPRQATPSLRRRADALRLFLVGLICQVAVACATATTPASAAPPAGAPSAGQAAQAISAIVQ